MHELSLCRNIIESIEESAVIEGFARVLSVNLEVGALAGVEIEALKFGFEAAKIGTLAQGSALSVSLITAVGKCRQCGGEMLVTELYTPCSHCGEYGLDFQGGDQLRIKSLEVV